MEIVKKQSVLGIGVSATDYGQVLRLCRQWVEQRRDWKKQGRHAAARPPGRCIFAFTVHSVTTAFLDRELMQVLNSADIGATDGMPLAWALRSFGVRGQRRVYGPDLMLALLGQAARLGYRVFFYGGSEQTLPVLCARLKTRFPRLEIAGAVSPPFRPLTPAEDAAYVKRILASDADILFVGIGAPKQERWIAGRRSQLPGVVMVGVGAAFNFFAGSVRQAPRWMQQAGLEWFFRLLMEPLRLWKRYLLLNPLFVVLWAIEWAGIVRFAGVAERPDSGRS